MRSNVIVVLILVLLGFGPTVHSFDEPKSDVPSEVTFQKVVLPFLAQNCFGCHGNGESKADLSLDKVML